MPDPLILILDVYCGDCGRESDGGVRGGEPIDYPFAMRRSLIRRQSATTRCPSCDGRLLAILESLVPTA